MIIGSGGYGKVRHPPSDDTIIPKKYRSNPDYVQRITDESKTQISDGEIARQIFDPDNKMSSRVIIVLKRKTGIFSEIMPYRQDCLRNLMKMYIHQGNLTYFWKLMKNMLQIFKGIRRLHDHGWIHHDIKAPNMLYDLRPTLRLYLIDWGTALRFRDVYSREYRHWHVASTQSNIPPEYKSFAHFKYDYPLQNNDFAHEYAKNPFIINILEVQPRYMTMLRKAHKYIQKRLHRNKYILDTVADKADVFALGLIICQIYTIFAKYQDLTPSLRNKILSLIRNMITPNPFKRWDMKKSIAALDDIIKSHSNKKK